MPGYAGQGYVVLWVDGTIVCFRQTVLVRAQSRMNSSTTCRRSRNEIQTSPVMAPSSASNSLNSAHAAA